MDDSYYQRFVASMPIDLAKWRDGIGYDLDALQGMTAAERASVEAMLLNKLHGSGDWRDVQALAALDTPCAQVAVEKARHHRNPEVRRHALRVLIRNPGFRGQSEIEELVIAAVEQGDYEMAESMPTPRVKRALLELTRQADDVTRVNAAALLMYLCGQAAEPFDWSLRPFFLRFNEQDPEALGAAWDELRRRVGM